MSKASNRGALRERHTLGLRFDSRVEDLLAQMVLEEKVGQKVRINLRLLGRKPEDERIRRGQAESVLTCCGATEINRLQRIAVEQSRLGGPLLIGNDVIKRTSVTERRP